MVIKKKLAILTVVKVRKKTLIMMMPIMLEVMTIGSIVHNLQLLCHHHHHHRGGGWNWNKEIIPCNHRDDLDWYTIYLWSGKCGKFWDSLQATISSTILLSNSIINIKIIQYRKTHRDNFGTQFIWTYISNTRGYADITISCWAYFQQNKIVKSQPITSLAGAGTAPDVSQSLISESVWSIRDISHTHIFIHPGGQIKMCFRHGLIKN